MSFMMNSRFCILSILNSLSLSLTHTHTEVVPPVQVLCISHPSTFCLWYCFLSFPHPPFLLLDFFLSQTSTISQLWRQERSVCGRLTVEPKKVESKEEKQLNMTISAMIGIGLYQLHFANNDELDTTRRKMVA